MVDVGSVDGIVVNIVVKSLALLMSFVLVYYSEYIKKEFNWITLWFVVLNISIATS